MIDDNLSSTDKTHMGRFAGKTILITGGAAGMGRATAEQMAREAGQIVIADRDGDVAEEVVNGFPEKMAAIRCDVTEPADLEAAVNLAIARFGGIDCVISNAGASGPSSRVDTVRADDFTAMMNLHVGAALHLLRLTVPHLKARGGGSFLMTTSTSGLKPGYAPVLYALSKGALKQLAEIAALELARHKIRVNCVCPGFVPTQIFARSMGFTAKTSEKFARRLDEPARDVQPIPRAGTPEDVAEAFAYLASDAAGFVTGHTLVVDGGLSLMQGSGDSRAVYAPIIRALGQDPEALAPDPAIWSQLGLGKDRAED